MPHSDLHKKKLSKNLIVLAIIIAFMATIWMVTMVKMAHAQGKGKKASLPTIDRTSEKEDIPYRARLSDEDEGGEQLPKQVFDIEESYIESRRAHLEADDGRLERWWYEDLSQSGGDDDRTSRPLSIERERQLRNTYNQNRGIGSISTTRP